MNIDAASVSDVVFMLGVWVQFVCVRIAGRSQRSPEIALQKLRILAHFLPPARRANALTPCVLMAGKPVEAIQRLAVEGKSGNVENEPRIVSTPPGRKPPAEPAAWIGIIFLTL